MMQNAPSFDGDCCSGAKPCAVKDKQYETIFGGTVGFAPNEDETGSVEKDTDEVLTTAQMAERLRAMTEVAFPDSQDAPAFESKILQEADKVAGTDRSRYYGHPLTNHRRIADIWSVLLGPILKRPLTPEEVVTCMIGLKLARLVNTPGHRDSLVDICGYVKCHEMISDVKASANNGVQGFC